MARDHKRDAEEDEDFCRRQEWGHWKHLADRKYGPHAHRSARLPSPSPTPTTPTTSPSPECSSSTALTSSSNGEPQTTCPNGTNTET